MSVGLARFLREAQYHPLHPPSGNNLGSCSGGGTSDTLGYMTFSEGLRYASSRLHSGRCPENRTRICYPGPGISLGKMSRLRSAIKPIATLSSS